VPASAASTPIAASPPSVSTAPSALAAAATNPLRKQTLLGIAPIAAPRSEAPGAAVEEAEAPFTPAPEPPPLRGQPLVVPAASSNPLRKQTLLGIAPVLPQHDSAPAPTDSAPAPRDSAPAPRDSAPVTTATEAHDVPAVAAAPTASEEIAATAPATPVDPATGAAVDETARASEPTAASAPSSADVAPVPAGSNSYSSLVTAAAVKTDAPVASDVAKARAKSDASATPASEAFGSTDDLPELRKRRPRWLVPLALAAVVALGVVGLRSLDRPPPLPPAGAEKRMATPGNPALDGAPIKKLSDNEDDGAPDPGSNTGPTTAPEAEPLKGTAEGSAQPSAAGSAAPAPSGDAPSAGGATVRVNVESDPPGARMFWRGKEVGTTPFVLDIPAGKRHAYELGLPGYITRKVVIDGSKTEISIGLRPDPSVPAGTKPRK
jgi:hypothetical protein